MNKKKTKRVDSRLAREEHMAARRQRFYQTGAPAFILMLLAFVLAASAILAFDANPLTPDYSPADHFSGRTYALVAAMILLLTGTMGLYVSGYEPKIVKSRSRGILLLVILLIMIAIVRFGILAGLSPYLTVVPVMITAIIMTIAFNQRFALGIGNYIALVSVLAFRNTLAEESSLFVLLATGTGMGVAVLGLKEIRTRTKIIEVCAFAALAVSIMVCVTGLWRGESWDLILNNCLYGAAGALSVGFVLQGLLPIIEKLFRTASNMTLLDYSEPNKPLLNRLAMEAPGTFNHSLQIGMLAEAAAKAIDANGLLCRVGSYYHDVGKLNKPRYFVENQADMFNQHRQLSPSMSRMIIMGHVKDGLEFAQEYKLPKILHQFIASHHGTTLVEYFYHEAMKQAGDFGVVSESEFRYPGPKPQTKEAAIVMISDVVEGATRALKEPTPSRIGAVVDEMILKRLRDGQFDECDLTLAELKQIKTSLVRSLCGMYHGRIAYPKFDKIAKKNGTKPAESDKSASAAIPPNQTP